MISFSSVIIIIENHFIVIKDGNEKKHMDRTILVAVAIIVFFTEIEWPYPFRNFTL
jgi:uncharacterized membrane protein YozB (DUF420 family)